jgi:hypothetical protein
MNKKFLIFGAVAVFGFMLTTAFGGKTKEQQMAEIEQEAQTQLEDYRVELQEACTARVMEEAERQFAEAQANAEKPVVTRKSTNRSSGPAVDPVPTTPPPTKSDKQTKLEGGSNTAEKQEKMTSPEPNTSKKKSKMQGGN